MTQITEKGGRLNHPEFSSADPLLDKTAGIFASLMTGQIPDRQSADYLPINGGAVSAPAETSLLLQYGITDHIDSLFWDSDLNLIPESLLEMLRCTDEMRIIDARRKIFDDSRRIKELEAEKAQVVQSRIDAVLTFFAQQKPSHIPENSGHPPDERTALLARLLQPEIRMNRANTDTALTRDGTLLFSREEIDDTARKTAAVSASAMAELDLLKRQTDRLRREKSGLKASLTDLIRLNRLLDENRGIIYHYFFKKEKRQILDNIPPLSDESRNLFQLAGLCTFIQGVLYRKFTPRNKLPRSIDLKKTGKNMLAQVHHQNRMGIDTLLKRMEAVILKNPAASQNQLNDFLDRIRSMEKELKPNPKTEVERTRPVENGRPVLYYLISVMENKGTPNHPVWQRKAWLIPKEHVDAAHIKRGILLKTDETLKTEEIPGQGQIYALTVHWGGISLAIDNSPIFQDKGKKYWSDMSTVTSKDLEAMHKLARDWGIIRARYEIDAARAKANGRPFSPVGISDEHPVPEVITFQEFEELSREMGSRNRPNN